MFAPSAPAAFEQPTEEALDSESTLSQLCFPNEFPYEFAFTSPEDSTETEDEPNDEEGDFLAGLTRRLALFTQRLPSPPPPIDKAKVNSTESTRSGLGSCTTSGNKSPNGPFSQAPSRPESPVPEKDSLKTKVANFDSKPKSRPNPKPSSFTPFPQNAAFYNYQYYYYWLRQPQTALVAYPFPVFAAPNAVKQPSAGTGVFLPRSHPNPSGSRKKGGKCVKLPTKVVQTQHSKTEKLPSRFQSRSQARLSGGRSKLGRGTKSAVTGGCV